MCLGEQRYGERKWSFWDRAVGYEQPRRAVPGGGIDGVGTGSVFNREESTTAFLSEELCLELLLIAYIQN